MTVNPLDDELDTAKTEPNLSKEDLVIWDAIEALETEHQDHFVYVAGGLSGTLFAAGLYPIVLSLIAAVVSISLRDFDAILGIMFTGLASSLFCALITALVGPA